MKTIEEIKAAVAAYANQHIPHYGDTITIGKIELTRSTVTKRNFAISFLDENGDSTTIWLDETIATTDARWQLLYSVLGLETRDALAPYKSENERLQSAWMTEKARNAALVAALEEIGVFATDEDGEEMDAFDMGQTIGEMVDDAIAANKKALATNTEKGGGDD